MITNDRAKRTQTRRMLTVAGFATIACSLIISIGPAMAAAGGNGNSNGNSSANGSNGNGVGNAGTVKIHDATTSLEAGLVGNEPWVCSFWVGFYSANAEVGTWELRSWAPTGDGSVVASGTYDTSGDGVDATSTLTVGNGHYRLDWAGIRSNAKQKTFWVACEAAPASDDVTPSDDAAPSDEAAPTDDAAPSDEAGAPSDEETPSDESAPSDEEAPSDESAPSDEEAPSGESAPSDEEAPSDESTPSDEETDPEGGASSEDVPPSDDESPSDEESAPSAEESTPDDQSPAESGGEPDQGGQQPEGEVKGGTSRDNEGSDDASQSGGIGNGSIPDTSVTSTDLNTGLGGVLAAIGVLLIVIAHAGTRRERHLPTA
ncbi:MAG TPA: hypothetical protein VF153_03060 [Candidatus Limnocylindria bacterium]